MVSTSIILMLNINKLLELTQKTLNHYSSNALSFWQGTKDHDVSQNISSLLHYIQINHRKLNHPTKKESFKILDFGCGPGRDLKKFKDLGHEVYGLDGCEEFCRMAEEFSGCKVYWQNFIDLQLPHLFFDGIFANASLFHVPKEHLLHVVKILHQSLAENGIFFSSNPRGKHEEFQGSRYANLMEIEDYKKIMEQEGFTLLHHYYRPQGLPQEECPWLACIFKKT